MGKEIVWLKKFGEQFRPHLRFVLTVESQLGLLAEQRGEFGWLTRTLDWIKQQQPDSLGKGRPDVDT